MSCLECSKIKKTETETVMEEFFASFSLLTFSLTQSPSLTSHTLLEEKKKKKNIHLWQLRVVIHIKDQHLFHFTSNTL